MAFYGIKIYDAAKERGETVKKAVILFSILLGAVFLMKTMQQNMIWKDDESLWSYLLKHRPESAMGHFGMGQVAYEQGREDEAFEHYKKSLAKNRTMPRLTIILGKCFMREGRRTGLGVF